MPNKEIKPKEYKKHFKEILKKFIYLKYGYYENYYFTFNEIMQILKINELMIIELSKKTLILAKEVSKSYFNENNQENIKIKSDR